MDLYTIFYYFSLFCLVLFLKFAYRHIRGGNRQYYDHQGAKKVCVIGAGVSGLVSTKSLSSKNE